MPVMIYQCYWVEMLDITFLRLCWMKKDYKDQEFKLFMLTFVKKPLSTL